jgi:hypothetical protein
MLYKSVSRQAEIFSDPRPDYPRTFVKKSVSTKAILIVICFETEGKTTFYVI